MVSFGIEVIENFDAYNKAIPDKKYHCANVPGLEKFYYGILKYLMKNHLKVFHRLDDGSGKTYTEIYESDLHDAKTGGRDDYRADAVELFIFGSHGNHTADFNSLVAFNSSKVGIGTSRDWKFGDLRLRWLIILACRLIVIQKVIALLPMFQGLRMYCGSWWSLGFDIHRPDDPPWEPPGMHPSEYIGESVGEKLDDGMPVSSSWVYGCKDDEVPWFNYPIVVTAELGHTLVKHENESWKLMMTTMNTDTLSSGKDPIPPQNIKWLNYYWAEI